MRTTSMRICAIPPPEWRSHPRCVARRLTSTPRDVSDSPQLAEPKLGHVHRTEVALLAFVRRFVLRVDQLPAWAFVAIAVVVFGLARAGRLFALLHRSRGGMELGGIVTLAAFLGTVIFAIRRRHVAAWRSTTHVLGAAIVGNALGIVLIWPFVPSGYDVALTPMLRDTLVAGAYMALPLLPVAIGMLWLSRRYGSHSPVTERRFRVIREEWRKRFSRDQGATD